MATAKINQKDYLKKYLGGGDDTKKKKKKKSKLGPKKVKIIDDDVDLTNLRPLEDGEFDILNSTEDAPQIAGIIDERGPVDFSDRKRWKIIADDGEGNVAISSSNDRQYQEESSSRRTNKKYACDNNDFSPPRVSMKESRHKHRESNMKNPDLSRHDREKSSSKIEDKNHNSSDVDLSPPRVSMQDSEKNHCDLKRKFNSSRRDREKRSSKREDKNHYSTDDDLSPPRVSMRDSGQKHRDSNRNFDSSRRDREKSPLTRKRKNDAVSDDDLSPPRVPMKDSGPKHRDSNRNSDTPRRDRDKLSTKRREKNYARSDDDLSPPRVQSRDSGANRRDSNRNFSDLRQYREKSFSRREDKYRTNNDEDLSPPRIQSQNLGQKYRNSHQNSDVSQQGRGKSSSERKKNHNPSDNDLSPPRSSMRDSEFTNRDSNRNPDSSRNDREKSSRNRKSRWTDESRRSQSPPVDKRMKKTLDGKTAGLQDAVALKEETAAYKKREAEFFNKMSAEVSGVGQAAVLRDRKTGKRRNLEAEAAVRREKEKRQDELDAKYAKWGKGLKQVDDQTVKLQQDLYEMSKPLARYADDADLDAELRAADRDGDPMREYMKQKQIKEGKRGPDRPHYQGSYMPNRFGIKPGHRWDGVDRSNGYEKKWFEARNAKTAIQEEAYKWSTADM